ncbi:MAG: 3'-5' exonuclease [Flavobacteriaceae bacterium]|nr:3'-5' exonuclease [Flavobacteriaceae bacterium]|tara:strand:- start:2922 stop:3635 length:714 start_codon:yes stop_codon:yes gene_type:complete
MLKLIDTQKILFLDIETVPEKENFDQLSEVEKELFAAKTSYQLTEDQTPATIYERAGIWAEFGKIVCISVGFFNLISSQREFRVKTFFGTEKDLLIAFKNLLETHFNLAAHLLCAHNGKEFDFPYIARRMIIHGINLPSKLNLFNKKPWEVPHLDTLHLWRFGDYKNYTSLSLIAHVLGIPIPKDDIDGSQVAFVYYKEKNINRIVTYCEKDVITVAQVVLRLRNEKLLADNEIIHL